MSVDLEKLSQEVLATVNAASAESVDLLRAFYYHCPPYQSNPPTDEERGRTARFQGFRRALERIPRFAVRLGHLQFRGLKQDGSPDLGQKQVDLLLGLDIALLAGKQQITHAALVAGDSDFVPAFGVAKQEGVLVWLFHGPNAARDDGHSTYSGELWTAADERSEMDDAFLKRVEHV